MKNTKLHDVTGRNRWCGPSAISAITGCTTDEAADLIRKRTGRRNVTYSYTADVMSILMNEFGVSYHHRYVNGDPVNQRPTLARWLRENPRKRGEVLLIIAGDHFQVVSGIRFVDSITKQVVTIRHPKVGRRRRVEAVYHLKLDDLVKRPEILDVIAQSKKLKKQEQRQSSLSRAQAIKGIEDLGGHVDTDDYRSLGHIYVYAAEEIEEHPDYPWHGDHIVLDWREARARVKDVDEFTARVLTEAAC